MTPYAQQNKLIIDGREIPFGRERNLLEVCRKADIDIPTFCYHSHLSVYGACRLCLVEVEGLGIVTSCTTVPKPGMRVRTTSPEIREMRRVAVELLLASHDRDCPTCPKNAACKLQSLARRLGVREVRFKTTIAGLPLDKSSPALERNPNRCILCGDCVRVCREVQSVGALDFAFRGSRTVVTPALGRPLGSSECVHCGQCAAVCPTGAIVSRQEIEQVWQVLADPTKKVIAQIAPAVRVAAGEALGLPSGTVATGQIAAALRRLGFAQVYDTCFAADLTVIEEGTEFLQRKEQGGKLPMFTSCCPAWVKFAEQYFPSLLGHLSSCRSPQQMFGSLAKATLPTALGVEPQQLVCVSIMPCTAKKFEARRPEFTRNGRREVDYVLTTQELIAMIEAQGLDLASIRPEPMDLPFGQKSGAGIIFGTTGGVAEAVLRYVVSKTYATDLVRIEFQEVRGTEGIREAKIEIGGMPISIAVVHGLANARRIAEKVVAGESSYDLIEVMACPMGCVGGAGQPVSTRRNTIAKRAAALYDIDRCVEIHTAQQNPAVMECYRTVLEAPASPKAHELLHTHYLSRRRVAAEPVDIVRPKAARLNVTVCVGTNCFLRGSRNLINQLVQACQARGWEDKVAVKGTFCFENCRNGPNVAVGRNLISEATVEGVVEEIERQLAMAESTEVAAR
ncbi:MAG: [FeFe] hydrogenase, group A [Candidatus Sumerlaeaceae bacterium]|jgi:NADH-quinone oxidoreductase subunit G